MSLEEEATRILAAENVQDVVSVELCARQPCGPKVMDGQPTVLIVARWVDDGCSYVWGRAVSRIKKLVDSVRVVANANGSLEGVDIAVEMVAENLELEKFVSPVTTLLMSRGTETDWPYIKDKVGQIINSHPATRGHARSISLFRLGFSTRVDENPNTVYVSVGYESLESTWPPVVREIQEYLDRYTYADLHLHFEHGVVDEHRPFHPAPRRTKARQNISGYLRPDTPYQMKVNLGSDIGACTHLKADDDDNNEYSPLVGTLGCWLEIKTKGHPEGIKVALTSYSVIRPAYAGFRLRIDAAGEAHPATTPEKDTELWNADENGIAITTASGRQAEAAATLEHPARSKHNNGVWEKSAHIEHTTGNLQARLQNELDGRLAFFDKDSHVLGTVFCASGRKRRAPSTNGRLDWALIRPLDDDQARRGVNALPPFETWEKKYIWSDMIPRQVACDDGFLTQPTEEGLRGLA